MALDGELATSTGALLLHSHSSDHSYEYDSMPVSVFDSCPPDIGGPKSIKCDTIED